MASNNGTHASHIISYIAIMDEAASHLHSRYGTLPICEDNPEELNATAQSNGSGQNQKRPGSRSQWFCMVGKVCKHIS